MSRKSRKEKTIVQSQYCKNNNSLQQQNNQQCQEYPNLLAVSPIIVRDSYALQTPLLSLQFATAYSNHSLYVRPTWFIQGRFGSSINAISKKPVIQEEKKKSETGNFEKITSVFCVCMNDLPSRADGLKSQLKSGQMDVSD